MRIPTAYQLSCGNVYTRIVDGVKVQLYRENGVYIVRWLDHSLGFWNYKDARSNLSKVIQGILYNVTIDIN